VDAYRGDLEKLRKREEENKKKIETLQHDIQKIETDIANLPNANDIKESIDQKTQQINELGRKIQDLQNTKLETNNAARKEQNTEKTYRDKLKELEKCAYTET